MSRVKTIGRERKEMKQDKRVGLNVRRKIFWLAYDYGIRYLYTQVDLASYEISRLSVSRCNACQGLRGIIRTRDVDEYNRGCHAIRSQTEHFNSPYSSKDKIFLSLSLHLSFGLPLLALPPFPPFSLIS